MNRINWSRVIIGGLVAGLVLNVVDAAVFGKLLAKDMSDVTHMTQAAMNKMIPWWVACDFLMGIALLGVYAAIRPRFGASVKTAVIAGLIVWCFVALLHGLG